MNTQTIKTITVKELAKWLDDNEAQPLLLDVREDNEVALCNIKGYRHIPMNLIPLRHNELPDDQPIVIYCHHGRRSLSVAQFLVEAGFTDLYNLTGGIDAWSLEVDPTVTRY